MPRRTSTLRLVLVPLLLTAALFVAVLRSGSPPAPYFRTVRPLEAHHPTRCTWYCHNRGCDHPTRLPPYLSETLFDRTVLALHHFGDTMSPGFSGYRAANLLVFCAAWPALMLALLVVAIRQRRRLAGETPS